MKGATMDDMMTEAWAGYVGLAVHNGAIGWQASLTDQQTAEFISGFDLVMAVYPDSTAPTGLYFIPIKGQDLWKRVVRGENRDIRSNAVPCIDRNDAIALLKRFGDVAWLNEFEAPKTISN
ncbi:MAG: hypothetical protein J0G33_08160 [Afipia felis]|nr:hypothetical protein [Afipia felis]